MALGSRATIVLNLSKLPLFPGVEAFARKPYLTRASATNAEYVESELMKEGKIDPVRLEFFYDAQTSGGILMSVPAEKAESAVAAARARGATATCVIGEVVERGSKAIVLRE
jgi:selenide,water dikinase